MNPFGVNQRLVDKHKREFADRTAVVYRSYEIGTLHFQLAITELKAYLASFLQCLIVMYAAAPIGFVLLLVSWHGESVGLGVAGILLMVAGLVIGTLGLDQRGRMHCQLAWLELFEEELVRRNRLA